MDITVTFPESTGIAAMYDPNLLKSDQVLYKKNTDTHLPCLVEQLDENDLISAIVSGSTHLYEVLVRPYLQRIYRIALVRMKNEEDARDVAQESLLKAFLKLNTFQGRSQFSTWLTSITINEARNRLRNRTWVKTQSASNCSESDGVESVALLADTREIPSQFLERQELGRVIEKAVAGLSADYRNVFVLRVVQELSTCETAALLQITSDSVKTRLHRARTLLQASLRSNWV